jgi:toxin FitB
MIILDTNVLSAIMQPIPDAVVARWLDSQPRGSMWITSITVMEILFGLQDMPSGRRREELTKAFARLLEELLQGRIAPFDATAAEHAARLMAQRRITGRIVDIRDTMIGSIAEATRGSVATRNVAHFADLGVTVINPWDT